MLAGPLFMCALLLAAAAIAKLWAPTPTRAALYAVGLPSATVVVVMLALVEMTIAAAVLVQGGRVTAAALAVAYAGFAGFVIVGRHSGRLTACGCFGRAGPAPGPVHIGFNGAAVALAIAAVVEPVPAIDAVLADQPWAGVPFIGLVVLGAVLSHAVLTALPVALEHVGSPPAVRGSR